MSGRRSVSRVRTRRSAAIPEASPERIVREVNLDEIDPERMLEYLRTTGRLSEPNPGPSGSAVPPSGNVDDASTRALSNMEAMFGRLLAHATSTVPASVPSTAPTAPTSTASTTGKPHLKFPDPPMFEGDSQKLDGWVTQTEMFLRAYDIDLMSSCK